MLFTCSYTPIRHTGRLLIALVPAALAAGYFTFFVDDIVPALEDSSTATAAATEAATESHIPAPSSTDTQQQQQEQSAPQYGSFLLSDQVKQLLAASDDVTARLKSALACAACKTRSLSYSYSLQVYRRDVEQAR